MAHASAARAAVENLGRTLAVEWGPRGVNVNAIAPGVFRTPLNAALLDGTERGREFQLRTPLRRFGQQVPERHDLPRGDQRRQLAQLRERSCQLIRIRINRLLGMRTCLP